MIEFKNSVNSDEIYIMDIIDDYTFNVEDFKKNLEQCISDEIIIYINSPGGSVFLGNSMANMIEEFKNRKKKKVKCIITGLCASISTQIAVVCDEIEMYENALFMIHNASCGVYGNKEELKKQIEILEKIDNLLADAYVRASKKRGINAPKELFIELMENESWLTAEQCVDLGLIDSVVDNEIQLVACAIDSLHYKNMDKLNPFIKKEEENNKELKELRDWLNQF